jgi:hypothetical protein
VRALRVFVKCRTLICHAPAPCTGRVVGEIDVAKTLERSTFPLKPEELVAKAKNVIATMFGTLDNDVLADDFRFVAPVVGPLVGIHARTHMQAHASTCKQLSLSRARARSLALSHTRSHRARTSFCASLAHSSWRTRCQTFKRTTGAFTSTRSSPTACGVCLCVCVGGGISEWVCAQ